MRLRIWTEERLPFNLAFVNSAWLLLSLHEGNIQDLVDIGLKTKYEMVGSGVKRYCKMINALPFAPEDEVLLAWDKLRPQLPSDLSSFAAYFEYTSRLGP